MPTPAPPLPARDRAWVLVATGLCLLPLLLQLPAWLGPAFGGLALVVAAASWKRPLPAALRLVIGLGVMIAVLSVSPRIGRDTACAILAGMLALKPAETVSLRDARSLLGFALFAPFATFLLDQGPLSLALAGLGAIVTLLALQRLAAHEGQRPAQPGQPAVRRVLWMVGLGLPMALAAFWLFPRLPNPLWGVPERAIARPGLSDSMTPGSWLELMSDDTAAARVMFDGPAPRPDQMYWRGPVLWNFDGRTWTATRWLRQVEPLPAVDAVGPGWRYQLELEPTDRRQLVALDIPMSCLLYTSPSPRD